MVQKKNHVIVSIHETHSPEWIRPSSWKTLYTVNNILRLYCQNYVKKKKNRFLDIIENQFRSHTEQHFGNSGEGKKPF